MKKVLDIFANIAKPFGNGQGQKEKAIFSLLKDNGIEAKYYEGLGFVVEEVEPLTKVCVSHIDLVHPFMKGFAEGRVFEIVEDRLFGALDNTLTNAVALLALIELRKEGKALDVRFVFTEGEESGLTGMSTYMRHFHEGDPLYINLDVTNDNWGKIASVEFDRPSSVICKQIYTNVENVGFTSERFTDDTSAILRYGGQGFSYCIPTDEYCHTYKSNCMIDTIEPYYNGLVYLLSELDASEKEHDLIGRYLHQDFVEKVFGE